MYKNLTRMLAILLLILAISGCGGPTTEEVIDDYYVVLEEALASGDGTAWLEFFADDATLAVPALAPQPVEGIDLIEAAMWPGVYGAVADSTIEMGQREIDGNNVTVYFTYLGGASGDLPTQDIFELNDDGKIVSLTVNVGTEAP